MRKTILGPLILAACAAGMAQAGSHQAHWGYTGHAGPAHWGELDPAYAVCASGVNQSPIDVADMLEAELPALGFDYSAETTEILNNGHTVQANFAPGNRLHADGLAFELKQVHFHTPSENHVKGQSYPLEAHFVHADQDGNLAVVAVMFEEGAENAALHKLWSEMPEKAGERQALTENIGGEALMPESRDYYRFNGSLTTPPCSEGVRWFVLKEPLSVSNKQVAHFGHLMHHPNNRPLQSKNARVVLQ